MNQKSPHLLFLFLIFISSLAGQEKPVQNVKGTIIDHSLKSALPGAAIRIPGDVVPVVGYKVDL